MLTREEGRVLWIDEVTCAGRFKKWIAALMRQLNDVDRQRWSISSEPVEVFQDSLLRPAQPPASCSHRGPCRGAGTSDLQVSLACSILCQKIR